MLSNDEPKKQNTRTEKNKKNLLHFQVNIACFCSVVLRSSYLFPFFHIFWVIGWRRGKKMFFFWVFAPLFSTRYHPTGKEIVKPNKNSQKINFPNLKAQFTVDNVIMCAFSLAAEKC
jgi:hypothetical protein